MKVYRGNLTMPPGATPAEHMAVREEFLRILRRWTKKTGHTLEILGILDFPDQPADPDDPDAHWDFVAYSDAPRSALRVVVSSAWRRAGGLRQSCVTMGADEVKAHCRYAAKDVVRSRRKRHYLPARGVKRVWYTRGFWQGHKPEDLWHQIIAEWRAAGAFGDAPSNTEDTVLPPSPTTETTTDPAPFDAHQDGHHGHQDGDDDPAPDAHQDDGSNRHHDGLVGGKTVSSVFDALRRERAERQAVLAEIDRRLAALPRRDGANVRAILPTTPDDAVMPEKLAAVADATIDAVEDYLRSRPFGVAVVHRPRGRWSDPLYYRQPDPIR